MSELTHSFAVAALILALIALWKAMRNADKITELERTAIKMLELQDRAVAAIAVRLNERTE